MKYDLSEIRTAETERSEASLLYRRIILESISDELNISHIVRPSAEGVCPELESLGGDNRETRVAVKPALAELLEIGSASFAMNAAGFGIDQLER